MASVLDIEPKVRPHACPAITTVISVEKMGPMPVRQMASTHALSSQRAAMLEWLQMQPQGSTVEAAAAAFSLHPNTAREHLAGLVQLGFAREVRESSGGRGRPATLYYSEGAQPEPDPRARQYIELVSVLARFVTTTMPNPPESAREAGLSWGRQLAERTWNKRSAQPATVIATALDDLGFAPRVHRSYEEVRLTRCPLRDVAAEFPGVICAVHQGVLDGLLESKNITDVTAELKPFHEPGACLIRLHPTTD